MSPRPLLPLLVVLACLNACTLPSVPGSVRASRAPQAGASPSPKPKPSAQAEAAPATKELLARTRLLKPAAASTLVSGTIRIDAGYAQLSTAGRIITYDGSEIIVPSALIGQDAAGLIGQDGAGVVAGGAGNLLVNDGANILSNDGASLIGQDGAGLGTGGSAGFRVAQAAAATLAPGTLLPAAGMVVRVINLIDNRPVPLGADDQGRPVYVVASDARGHYELHLPDEFKDNVRIVASMAGSDDLRLRYNLVVPPKNSTEATYDEYTSLVSAYIRLAMVARMAPVLASGDPDRADISSTFDSFPALLPIAGGVLRDLMVQAQAAGVSRLDKAQQARVLQRFSDHIVGLTDIDAIALSAVEKYVPTVEEPAVRALTELFGKLADGAAALMATEDLNQRSYILEANSLRRKAGAPLYTIRKPADLVSFVIEEYLGSNEVDHSRQAAAVFTDMGIAPEQYRRLVAAYTSIYLGLGASYLGDETVNQAVKATLLKAIAEELAAT